MKKSYLLSKIWYYMVIAVVFIILSGVFLLFGMVGFMSRDWANNVASECWGLAGTVLFLMALIDLRELKQWIPVRDMVLRKIGRELYSLFDFVTHYCEGMTSLSEMAEGESHFEYLRRSFISNLELLKLDVRLTEIGKDQFLMGEIGRVFSETARNLADIEARYSRFLESSLRLSLMRIQEDLDGLTTIVSHSKEIALWYGSEEVFLGLIERRIHSIVKEVYKTHKEKEIEIW